MAITSKQKINGGDVQNFASGAFIDTGTVKKSVFRLGFVPKYVKLVNATDRTIYEWFDGMAADSAIKAVAAGTLTLDTSNGITVGAIACLASAPVTIYENEVSTVGVPGTDPVAKTDNSRVNTVNETVVGFSIPAAVAITNKQFYYIAHD